MSELLTQKATGTTKPGKPGCLSGFMCTQLYLWPYSRRLTVRHSQHSDAADRLVHGTYVYEQDVKHNHEQHFKHNHAPGLSQKMKDWVHSQLLDGQIIQQINTQSRLTASHTSRSNGDRRQVSQPHLFNNLILMFRTRIRVVCGTDRLCMLPCTLQFVAIWIIELTVYSLICCTKW